MLIALMLMSVVMGHDWEGEFDFLKDKCEVIYLNRTEGISTTKIKQNYMVKTRNNLEYQTDVLSKDGMSVLLFKV